MPDDVGLESVPNDAEIVGWLNHRFSEHSEQLVNYLREFNEVVELTRSDGEPIEFAYARLLNNLALLDSPKVLNMLAAMIWRSTK